MKHNKVRNREVEIPTKELLKMKKEKKVWANMGCLNVFSSIKRIFGEYTSTT